MATDRRQAHRFQTSLDVDIRYLVDGIPIKGHGVEVGPNGMRVITHQPLMEAAYVHISFVSATNNTHCEGRVVWTQRAEDRSLFESGVDIQRWGGGVPGADVVYDIPDLKPVKDRRKRPR
ncbi:MAG: PilZ domain-containing protein [Elusimicrobia bacterium]|nr:PilZ domain-containing protein [Candidatus Obscuribacterium magneticum]